MPHASVCANSISLNTETVQCSLNYFVHHASNVHYVRQNNTNIRYVHTLRKITYVQYICWSYGWINCNKGNLLRRFSSRGPGPNAATRQITIDKTEHVYMWAYTYTDTNTSASHLAASVRWLHQTRKGVGRTPPSCGRSVSPVVQGHHAECDLLIFASTYKHCTASLQLTNVTHNRHHKYCILAGWLWFQHVRSWYFNFTSLMLTPLFILHHCHHLC